MSFQAGGPDLRTLGAMVVSWRLRYMRRWMMGKPFRALSVVVVAVLVAGSVAQACGLDGVPSLLVNTRLVLVNRALPASGHLAIWAPFTAPGPYRAGQSVRLQEMRGRVLWTLPPSAFRTPWRWTFGDGTEARGLSVRHTYRWRGTYVVHVRAYLVDGHDSQWYPFDAAVIQVR